ncbi:MAG: folate-binding protein [Gammaproteobacteria bacterium]|nr:folate-binding protein [Gammaproteobacteria bacterium]MDH3448683.1 folate-binding protein [Gammaproteobacteria bacterium]
MKQWQDFSGRQSNLVASDNFICATDDLGLILVSGPDARDFLQNQLSNDIDLIDETRLQLSSYSTPKGRMLGIFRVIQVSNGYLLLTVKSMVVPLLERLYRFIVQSRVTLADASDYFARFAIVTDRAEIIRSERLPAEVNGVIQDDSVISMQLEKLGRQRRYLLMCLSPGEAFDLWGEFATGLQVAAFSSWHLSEIRAGIPAIYPQTAEEFVLQMANLGPLGGVSFKKGCYPGQEIVARMQYLGKLKRRMFLARLETGKLPQPGDELAMAGSRDVDGSGKVVDAEFDPEGICHCLYIAQIAKAETGALQLLGQPETHIDNVELPYSFEK